MFEPTADSAEGGSDAGSSTGTRGREVTATTAAAVADVLAAARRLAAVVANGGAGDATARRAVLAGLRPVDGVLATVRSTVLLAERDSTTWQRPGVASFEAAHGTATRGGVPGARREIRQAEVLATMPALAAAVDRGTLPLGHLDTLARVAATSSPQVGAALASPGVQDTLVRMGTTQDGPTFARSMQRMVAELDPTTRQAAHDNQRARRFLHLSDQADGTHLRGLLDRVAGHRLRLALEATGQRPGLTTAGPDNTDGGAGAGAAGSGAGAGAVLEERTAEQARADALDVIARRILSLPETASGAAVPPQISLLMTEQTFAALRAHHAATRPGPTATLDATGEPTTSPVPTMAGVPPVTLEDGTPLPGSEVAQILCDCEITRIVMDAADQPVNLGRTARLYTGAHRRAIIARDRECTFPGCHQHARWSQIHHIRWWDRDTGETSLDNAVLLCSYHHHQVHQHNLTIHRHPRPRGPHDRYGPEPPGTRYTFHNPTGHTLTSHHLTDHEGPPGATTTSEDDGHASATSGGAVVCNTRDGAHDGATELGGEAVGRAVPIQGVLSG